jgi:hypothetical protein
MFKKLFLLLAVCALAIPAFAVDIARTNTKGKGVDAVNGVGDISNGYTANVDAYGGLQTREGGKQYDIIEAKYGSHAAVLGPASVYGVMIAGMTAGQFVLLSDGAEITHMKDEDKMVLDIWVATTNERIWIPIEAGIRFNTDVVVGLYSTAHVIQTGLSSTNQAIVTVIYEDE